MPQLPIADIDAILAANRIPRDRYPVVSLALRGYWLDSYGKKGSNDRSYYDDAQILVWPDGVARFPANTDPNGYRKGEGTGSKKGMAMLKTGVHLFGTGLHRGSLGYRQAEDFTVIRDGIHGDYEDKGQHAIDIHSGSGDAEDFGRTSSLGCQTLPPAHWKIFLPLSYKLLKHYNNEKGFNDRQQHVHILPYVLIDEAERRKGNLQVSRRFEA